MFGEEKNLSEEERKEVREFDEFAKRADNEQVTWRNVLKLLQKHNITKDTIVFPIIPFHPCYPDLKGFSRNNRDGIENFTIPPLSLSTVEGLKTSRNENGQLYLRDVKGLEVSYFQ